MQIAVTFRHMENNEGVKAYVQGKAEKLQKYIENPKEIHVVLTAEKFRHTAEIVINSDGITFTSEGRDNDLYAAIDQMMDKIERQIRERREKGKRKRTGLGSQEASPSPDDPLAKTEEDGEPAVVMERKSAFAKPMSPEEAIAHLNLAKDDLLFFVNSDSGRLNAVRRKGEGRYEWIEPQPE